MANKQTRRLKKLNLKTRNLGPNTQETPIEQGKGAFRHPDKAVEFLKEHQRRSWRINKNHPSNPKK